MAAPHAAGAIVIDSVIVVGSNFCHRLSHSVVAMNNTSPPQSAVADPRASSVSHSASTR